MEKKSENKIKNDKNQNSNTLEYHNDIRIKASDIKNTVIFSYFSLIIYYKSNYKVYRRYFQYIYIDINSQKCYIIFGDIYANEKLDERHKR